MTATLKGFGRLGSECIQHVIHKQFKSKNIQPPLPPRQAGRSAAIRLILSLYASFVCNAHTTAEYLFYIYAFIFIHFFNFFPLACQTICKTNCRLPLTIAFAVLRSVCVVNSRTFCVLFFSSVVVLSVKFNYSPMAGKTIKIHCRQCVCAAENASNVLQEFEQLLRRLSKQSRGTC